MPVKMSVPGPAWLKLPVPLIAPAKVRLLLWLNTRAALSITLPAMLPVVLPFPICKVPAPIVVPPV